MDLCEILVHEFVSIVFIKLIFKFLQSFVKVLDFCYNIQIVLIKSILITNVL